MKEYTNIFCFQLTMADYQYGLSNIQDNHILHQVIAKRKKMCESVINDPPGECFS
jgi:hypothetical protein